MTAARGVAIELDALGDTRALWGDWLDSAATVLGLDPASVPRDRGEAAAALDGGKAGNWRALLGRFSEDRAAAYLRRDAVTSAALRSLATQGRAVGVFTDAPEELARVALAHLGGERRTTVLETGIGALERVLARLGQDAVVVTTRDELRTAAEVS